MHARACVWHASVPSRSATAANADRCHNSNRPPHQSSLSFVFTSPPSSAAAAALPACAERISAAQIAQARREAAPGPNRSLAVARKGEATAWANLNCARKRSLIVSHVPRRLPAQPTHTVARSAACNLRELARQRQWRSKSTQCHACLRGAHPSSFLAVTSARLATSNSTTSCFPALAARCRGESLRGHTLNLPSTMHVRMFTPMYGHAWTHAIHRHMNR